MNQNEPFTIQRSDTAQITRAELHIVLGEPQRARSPGTKLVSD